MCVCVTVFCWSSNNLRLNLDVWDHEALLDLKQQLCWNTASHNKYYMCRNWADLECDCEFINEALRLQSNVFLYAVVPFSVKKQMQAVLFLKETFKRKTVIFQCGLTYRWVVLFPNKWNTTELIREHKCVPCIAHCYTLGFVNYFHVNHSSIISIEMLYSCQ